jgi:hypothetical protein
MYAREFELTIHAIFKYDAFVKSNSLNRLEPKNSAVVK